jgi:hypothetical protein
VEGHWFSISPYLWWLAECSWGGALIVEKVFQSCILGWLWGGKTKKNSFVISEVEW